jgi:hypothetical protein
VNNCLNNPENWAKNEEKSREVYKNQKINLERSSGNSTESDHETKSIHRKKFLLEAENEKKIKRLPLSHSGAKKNI